MTGWLLSAAALGLGVALTCFAIRRILLLVAGLLPPRPMAAGSSEVPSVTLVVAARNEAPRIDRILDALAKIEYPPERLFVVLVNDGSTDATGERLSAWASARPRALALDLPSVGKFQALNEGIAAGPASDLIAVCDADLAPAPDWLRRLAGAFNDDTVGGAAAFLRPENAEASAIARYAAVESWVCQLVTSAGKDRLDLNPPTLGAAAYRRTALDSVGWFRAGRPGGDVSVTAALTEAGWRTRFVPAAIAENEVVERWRDYWRQHIRWSHNLFGVGGRRRGARGGRRVADRIEAWMVSTGYVDRLALVGVLVLAAAGALPLWLPVAYLLVVGCELFAALVKAGAAPRSPSLLFWTATLFPLDAVASGAAAARHVSRRATWHSPRRPVPSASPPLPEMPTPDRDR